MWLQVNPRSAVPVYQQVVEGVKAAVAKHLLSPGDRLPSVRELAIELVLNPNTVAKAYRELEHERLIEVQRGRGTFIARPAGIPNKKERIEQIRETMTRLLVESHHLQLSDEQLLEMFRDVMVRFHEAGGGIRNDDSD